MKQDLCITNEELSAHHCLETVDRVGRDPETTAFKRRVRLHQALWREANQWPIGSEPMRPKPNKTARPLGSRIDVGYAHSTGANFLTQAAREAARKRVGNKETWQTLSVDRLYADMLSSMPMCFNLFGPLAMDPSVATEAVRTWWPDAPGRVRQVRFEWSPGRRIGGRFLENSSAFDAAFELEMDAGARGVIGIETKYHEHSKREKIPSGKRLQRYEKVTKRSGIFKHDALDTILGTHLQQIWLDHLLALSMLQEEASNWKWAKFVLVHPAENPSFARVAEDYVQLLRVSSTFEVRTIESLLNTPALTVEDVALFKNRYLW